MDSSSDDRHGMMFPRYAGLARHSRRTKPRSGHIHVHGCPDTPMLKTHLVPFVDFAMRSILSAATYNRVNVNIRFAVPNEPDCSDWAAASPVDWKKKCPSTFDIEVFAASSVLREIDQLLVISHELVHVKQYATGQLRGWQMSDGKVAWRWNGKNNKETNYWMQPWEVEAHGLERVLLHFYCQQAGMLWFDQLFNVLPSPPVDPTSVVT